VQVVAAVVLGAILVLKLLSGRHKKQLHLPPGPPGLPVIGHLHLMGPHPHEDLAKLSATYGPVMSLWFGQKLTVVASSPAAAEEILKTQGLNFSSRNRTSFGELIVTNGTALDSGSCSGPMISAVIYVPCETVWHMIGSWQQNSCSRSRHTMSDTLNH
jgi:hypothetical protein